MDSTGNRDTGNTKPSAKKTGRFAIMSMWASSLAALQFASNYLNSLSGYVLSDESKESLISALNFTLLVIVLAVYITVAEPVISTIVESRALRFKLQGYMFRLVETLLNLVYDQAFEYEIHGMDEINPEALGVILSNHQGFLDYMTITHVAAKCGIENSNFFFVWRHCVRVPSLQVLYNSWRKKSNWRVPKIVLPEVFAPVLESPWRDLGGKWVTIFPEVTTWSPTAMLEHRAECADSGCPKLDNLLYPRFNAFVQTVGFLRDYPLSDVYDLTVLYVNTKEGHNIGVPSWKDVLFSNRDWKINISIKRTSVSSLPQKEKNLTRWLEKQWFQKDQMITMLRSKMAASIESTPGRPSNKKELKRPNAAAKETPVSNSGKPSD